MSNDRRYITITNNRKTHSGDSSKRHYWKFEMKDSKVCAI